MGLDINKKDIIKNAFRISKKRNETAIRIRVPGGHLNIKYLDIIKHISEKYGNGHIHLTTRQGFEIPGINLNDIDKINSLLTPLIEELKNNKGVEITSVSEGYPAAGTRNISACIGNRVCQFANTDTTALAQRIEKEIFPNNYHVKVAITGCPNDCIKARMHDFGIVAICEPIYNYDLCIGCEACVKTCKLLVTGALSIHNGKIKRDTRRCIGCGECVLKCPTYAWTRDPRKFFTILIMGRTGKKNPRIAERFIHCVDEDSVVSIIKNCYKFIEKYIDRSLPKEHVGYIVDRVGYQVFRNMVFEGVELNQEARVSKHIQWGGFHYANDIFLE